MGSVSRLHAAEIAAGKPASAGHISAELNNIINNGINDNDVRIDSNLVALTAIAANVAALESSKLDVEHQTGDFTLGFTTEPIVVLDGTTIQHVTLGDATLTFPEGNQRIIICNNPEGAYVECATWLNAPAVAELPLLPGDQVVFTSVGSGNNEKWAYRVIREDSGVAEVDLTSDYTVLLSDRRLMHPGSGSGDVLLPPITKANYGQEVFFYHVGGTLIRIRPAGDDRFSDGATDEAAVLNQVVTLVALSAPSGVGAGFKWFATRGSI